MAVRGRTPFWWWFREGWVAGIARPGFNIHWLGTLSLRERIVFSWLGKLNGTRASVHEFHEHLDWYRRMAARFGFDAVDEIEHELRPLADVAELGNVLDRVTTKNKKR